MTLKFLNKISAFFFSIRSLCNMRERSQGKSIIVYAVALWQTGSGYKDA